MTKESEFRAVKYSFRRGFLAALACVYEELTKMHADYQKFDRYQIDYVWSKVKSLENKVRDADLGERG